MNFITGLITGFFIAFAIFTAAMVTFYPDVIEELGEESGKSLPEAEKAVIDFLTKDRWHLSIIDVITILLVVLAALYFILMPIPCEVRG